MALQENGMQALGWNYVNLDDCWALQRDPENETLQWDTERFPSGIPALIDWLHERHFKFGLYTSAGNQTCSSGGRPEKIPGSRGHYDLDAATFASWGVDYIKLDWCGDIKYDIPGGHAAHLDFANAVLKTNRSMFLEVVAGYWFFLGDIGSVANSWRFCEDHHDNWKSTSEQLVCRISQVANATGRPGAWAFMDMLDIGGAGCAKGTHCPGQTDDECVRAYVRACLPVKPLFACLPACLPARCMLCSCVGWMELLLVPRRQLIRCMLASFVCFCTVLFFLTGTGRSLQSGPSRSRQ